MKYTCIIVDDEPLSHKVLKNHIAKLPELRVLNSFYNAIDARNWLRKELVDIILLDIQMPEITGLEFLRSLKIKPVTIVTTAFRDYAVEGFELGVIDYLLKPIQFSRLEVAINRAIDFLRLAKNADTVAFNPKTESGNFELLLKTGTTRVFAGLSNHHFCPGIEGLHYPSYA